ncbi:MAG: bifunctional oligoribonuclease/PAP phosphatase NrnA [Magnetococcales bacterium]|nr:bifunctional oligoribonuclease/PAP phosphatase NrnA [Magnetococcales bacterium]
MANTPPPENPSAALMVLLSGREGERHAVVLQDFPDPDAISCGFAYCLLAEANGIEAEMIYGGRISHQENLALINLLDIELIRYTPEAIPPGRYQGAVFVDNQGTTSALTETLEQQNVPILAIVDHHNDQGRLTPLFLDLRPVGACASIFAEYLSEGLLALKPSRPDHRRLATALMHGIVSDTEAMVHAKSLDFKAAAFLEPFIDKEILVTILHQKRSHKVMEVIKLALANRVVRDGLCLSGVGYLRAEERDAIPQAADFLLTEENVHTAVVYGVVRSANEHEAIHGSLRTTKNTLGPDSFLKETLGKSDDGSYYGGGKAMAGGFEIPLGFLSGQDDLELDQTKWRAFDAKIRRRFMNKIGIEEA